MPSRLDGINISGPRHSTHCQRLTLVFCAQNTCSVYWQHKHTSEEWALWWVIRKIPLSGYTEVCMKHVFWMQTARNSHEKKGPHLLPFVSKRRLLGCSTLNTSERTEFFFLSGKAYSDLFWLAEYEKSTACSTQNIGWRGKRQFGTGEKMLCGSHFLSCLHGVQGGIRDPPFVSTNTLTVPSYASTQK